MATQTLDNLNVKVDASDKQKFTTFTHALGTTPSNAIRMFIKAFNEYQGFPFNVSRPYKLSAEAQRSYDALNADIANGTAKTYDSFDDILAEVDDELKAGR